MELLDLYNSLYLEDVVEYINSSKEENLNLEFKSTSTNDFSNSEDKKNFAKALSGFANSNGGIIIWGIRTVKNDSGIEIAKEEKLIDDLLLFVSKLNQLTGEFVKPIVENIVHKKIEKENNVGFAVSFIPESNIGPHMAKASENRYYKRSGDSFYIMEHYDIEDMFGRRKKPKLEINYNLYYSGRSGSKNKYTENYRLIIGIHNYGRGTAKYPYLALNVDPPYKLSEYGVDGNMNFGLPRISKRRTNNGFAEFGSSSESVIHPNTNVEVAGIDIKIPNDMNFKDDIHIKYKLCSEDFPLFESILFLNHKEILESILN